MAKRYFGPFQIRRRIGEVAYELDLPVSSRVHNVFHVSLLRPFRGTDPQQCFQPIPSDFSHSDSLLETQLPLSSLNRQPENNLTNSPTPHPKSTSLPTIFTSQRPNFQTTKLPSASTSLLSHNKSQPSTPTNNLNLGSRHETLVVSHPLSSIQIKNKTDAPISPHKESTIRAITSSTNQNASTSHSTKIPLINYTNSQSTLTSPPTKIPPINSTKIQPINSFQSQPIPTSQSTPVIPIIPNISQSISFSNPTPLHEPNNIISPTLEDKVNFVEGSIVSGPNCARPKREVQEPIWMKDFIKQF